MKILFIGGGNMAFAIISGLASKSNSIFVIDPIPLARKKILKLALGNTCNSSVEVFRDIKEFSNINVKPTWIILAIKPQQIHLIYKETRELKIPWISTSPILSIVAGLSIKTLKVMTKNKNIIRAMPNTPALIKMGVTGYYSTKNTPLKIQKQAIKILSQIGEVIKVSNEPMIDAVTAISGSGPGYIFKFISAIEKAAIKTGLPKTLLKRFIFPTLNGSLQLWKKSKKSPKDLIKKVASKGGTTEAALSCLVDGGFDGLIIKAIKRAKNRSKNLSLEIDRQVQKNSNK